jgi:hypothetical protein
MPGDWEIVSDPSKLTPDMPCYTIGIDLGLIQDYSALAVVERLVKYKELPFAPPILEDQCHVRHIHRWDLGTPYPVVIKETGELIRRANLQDAAIVIDGTGVGKAVCRLFDDAYQRGELGNWWPSSYVITGGRETTKTLVPKRELVSKMQALLQGGRLRVADQLFHAVTLRNELLAFRAKTLPSGHESYESARERDHDDIVLAVALAAWFKHNNSEPRFIDGSRVDEKASVA